MNEEIEKGLEAFSLMAKYFNGDQRLAKKWFHTPNEKFEGLTPNQMVRTRRVDELLYFIYKTLPDHLKPENNLPARALIIE